MTTLLGYRQVFLALVFLAAATAPADPAPDGTWEGVMGEGSHVFRVAFVLREGLGKYYNIDDGLHGEPMTLQWNGANLHAQTAGGGVLDLAPSGDGEEMTGVFRQGEGKDTRQSLVGQNSYPVTLQKGEAYLHPRLAADGTEETGYRYQVPEKTTDGWETENLKEAGLESSKIEAVVRKILQKKYPHIHSLLVVRDGRLALDEYFYGYGPEDVHPVQSITKPIFSLLFGIAEKQGLVRPEQRLRDYFPDIHLRKDWEPTKDQITLESLLTMTSGLGCDDFKDMDSCSWAMFQSDDWLVFFLSLPSQSPPGLRFAYCGACLTPLAVILEKQSGLGLPQYAQKFLFGPLGIQEPRWWEGPKGIHSPAFGLALRPRDMAKLGQLVLQKGNWEGREVVPGNWITRSTSPHVPNTKTGKEAAYGYLWWERNVKWRGKELRSFDAWGVGGQHVFIVPDLNLVCVLTGGNYKDGKLANNSFKIFHEVLEALH